MLGQVPLIWQPHLLCTIAVAGSPWFRCTFDKPRLFCYSSSGSLQAVLIAYLFWLSNIKIEKKPQQDSCFSGFNSKRARGLRPVSFNAVNDFRYFLFGVRDRKSTRLNSSHGYISYA